MPEYVEVFDPNEILGTQPANGIDDYIATDTRKSLNERYMVEHVALDSSELGANDSSEAHAQGRHKPGKVGVLFYGTHAELNHADMSNGLASGQLGYATDAPYTGFYHWVPGSGWQALIMSASDVAADDITLQFTGASPSILGMKHDNQQWTTTFVLPDEAIITTDCNNSNSFSAILGGNRTLANPTNPEDGATYIWFIKQGVAGSHTLAYGTDFAFPAGVAPILTTDANAVDMLMGFYLGGKFYCSMMYDVK